MSNRAELKQSHNCRKCSKCLGMMFATTIGLALVLSASILSPGLSSSYPFHAQCKLQWTWDDTNCTVIHVALHHQVLKWTGPDNCIKGGEKCLYSFVSNEPKEMKLTHTTPVKKYVDSITFDFCDSNDCLDTEMLNQPMDRLKRSVSLIEKIRYTPQTKNGCAVSGFSRSNTWYAYLDYGTNYCNMRNLVEGAGLTKLPNFKEITGDNMCTMYSRADCEKY